MNVMLPRGKMRTKLVAVWLQFLDAALFLSFCSFLSLSAGHQEAGQASTAFDLRNSNARYAFTQNINDFFIAFKLPGMLLSRRGRSSFLTC
jgi:hypothetical protein